MTRITNSITKVIDAAKGKTLTAIYPRDVKPVHVGAYARNYGPNWGWQFCHWDGTNWCYAGMNVRAANAQRNRNLTSPYQEKEWCGVSK